MNIVQIWKFDDGREYCKQYPNEWIIVEKKFGGGKLVLKNKDFPTIIIDSISSWKTKQSLKNNIYP